jgi:hypothetical protein
MKSLWKAILADLHGRFGGNLQPYCDGAPFATRGVAPHDKCVNAKLERRTSTALPSCLSMILSENRLPLFRIML